MENLKIACKWRIINQRDWKFVLAYAWICARTIRKQAKYAISKTLAKFDDWVKKFFGRADLYDVRYRNGSDRYVDRVTNW